MNTGHLKVEVIPYKSFKDKMRITKELDKLNIYFYVIQDYIIAEY